MISVHGHRYLYRKIAYKSCDRDTRQTKAGLDFSICSRLCVKILFMKILVTGGSGFLGTHVRNFLDADDFSRRSGFDILNFQDVTRVSEYDVVIHLAALLDKNPASSGHVFLTNVEGTVNILREMKEGAVFIFASTKDVYGRFADGFQEVPESCQTLYAGQSALEWSKLHLRMIRRTMK